MIIAGYASGPLVDGPADHLGPDHQLRRRPARPSPAPVCLSWWSHQHQGGPAPAAVRVVAPTPSVRLPRRRARSAASAVDRARSSSPRQRPRCTGGRYGQPRRRTILVWRIWLPLWRSLRHGLRVTSVVREASDVVSVYLTGRRLDRLPVRAGPVPERPVPRRPGWTRANPFSLSAAPDGRSLRITAKALGEGSARLASLRPGTRVLFEGPYGRLSSRARTRRKVLLAGAGVGITPLRALAEGLDYGPGEAILLQRYTDEPLFVARDAGPCRPERSAGPVPSRARGARRTRCSAPRRAACRRAGRTAALDP